MKHKVTKVTTGFSERLDLNENTFSSIAQFDMFVIMSYADDYTSNYMGYDKTDVVITFEDGFEYSLRFDAEPGQTLVGHFANLRQYYIEGSKPEYVSWKDWNATTAEYKKFFEEYRV